MFTVQFCCLFKIEFREKSLIKKLSLDFDWKKLRDLYMKKFSTNHLHLKQRLYTIKMKEGTPICDHLVNFNNHSTAC